MTALALLIGNRPAVFADWPKLADAWGVNSDYTLQNIAPPDVSCTTCWGWLVCAECLGEYPHACPACNGTGLCHCREGK